MDFHAHPAEITDYAAMHEYLSTAPASPFVRVATVQRRDSAGADVLRGLVLSRLGSDSTETVIESQVEWYEALATTVRIAARRCRGLRNDERLWTRVLAAHREYERLAPADRFHRP